MDVSSCTLAGEGQKLNTVTAKYRGFLSMNTKLAIIKTNHMSTTGDKETMKWTPRPNTRGERILDRPIYNTFSAGLQNANGDTSASDAGMTQLLSLFRSSGA